MSSLREALRQAGLVTPEAAQRVEDRARKKERERATTPAPGKARRQWLAEVAKVELLGNPTSETARHLIQEAHERFDDGSDEFRRFLRPLYELRDRLDATDRGDHEQFVRRALRRCGQTFEVGSAEGAE